MWLLCVCSQVEEHGDGRGVARTVPPRLPQPPGGGAEGWMAEETTQHHEELAATLVRAALRSSLLLQRRGRNQTAGNASDMFGYTGSMLGGEVNKTDECSIGILQKTCKNKVWVEDEVQFHLHQSSLTCTS